MLHFLVNIITMFMVIFNDIVMVEKKEKNDLKTNQIKINVSFGMITSIN